MANKLVVEQETDCAFGENHKIYLTMEGRTVKNITCSCYKNKKEVEGLIKLGELQDATCLQGMKFYIDSYITETKQGGMSWHIRSNPYRDSAIGFLGTFIASGVKDKKKERMILKHQIAIGKEQETIMARSLKNHIQKEIGSLNEYFSVQYDVKENLYTFNTVRNHGSQWDQSRQEYLPAKQDYTPIAKRIDGAWHLVPNHMEIIEGISNDRRCAFCEVYGGYTHTATEGHKSKVRKYTFIALQASSHDGMKLSKENKNNSDFCFKYRKGSKKVIGVVAL